MKIQESLFENNNALNGGALYFNIDDRNTQNQYQNEIEILNTKFINNKAEYLGGAIYSNFYSSTILKLINSNFIDNKAYAGGAIYIHKDYESNELKSISSYYVNLFNKSKFLNNISISHGNDYASNPCIINLISPLLNKFTVKNGDDFPMEFNLIDMFNQTVQDVSKYYSNIMLSLIDSNMLPKANVKITGNSCAFSRGKYIYIYIYIDVIIHIIIII